MFCGILTQGSLASAFIRFRRAEPTLGYYLSPLQGFGLNSRQFVKSVSKPLEFGVSLSPQRSEGIFPLNEFIPDTSSFKSELN